MTEDFQDQISAFADDELSAEECEFLVRRLERDPESRAKVLRYAAIGSALRGDLLGPNPDVFRDRLRQSLDGVSVVPNTTYKPPSRSSRMLRPVLGAGIAASVAAVGLLVLSSLGPESADGPTLAAQLLPIDADNAQAMSYVVPQETDAVQRVAEPVIQQQIRLTNYLVRHGEYAFPIGRTSIDSNVVSGQDDWRVADQAPAE